MQIAYVDRSVGAILSVYLYPLLIVLLSMNINSAQVINDVTPIDNRQSYGTVLYNSVGRCFDMNDPRIIEAKRIFQVLNNEQIYSKHRYITFAFHHVTGSHAVS